MDETEIPQLRAHCLELAEVQKNLRGHLFLIALAQLFNSLTLQTFRDETFVQ